jgi:[ribosomal protein S18]-alanine N-acetyltransferase
MTMAGYIEKTLIREYQKGDFQGVSEVWLRTGIGNPVRGDTEESIEESIRIGGSLLVQVEETEGSIIGTSWMTYDGRRVHLHHFGILPEFQGQGLSKTLLEHSLKFVCKKGVQVKLEVNENNHKAIKLYTKYGFERLGDYDIYIIRDISRL